MPITNTAFCEGFKAKATPWATNPYPQRSSDHWAWEKGRASEAMPTSTRAVCDGSEALLELLEVPSKAVRRGR